MQPWRIESNPVKQAILTAVVLVVGIVLVYGFRNFDDSGFTNSLAGFLLGVLLLLISIPALIFMGTQAITVDPKVRCIFIEDVNRFRVKQRRIAFSDILDVFVGTAGKRSNGMRNYYIVLRLKSGKTQRLFADSFYDGRFSRSVTESRCQRLQQLLESSNEQGQTAFRV
jgi:hypothetical protein